MLTRTFAIIMVALLSGCFSDAYVGDPGPLELTATSFEPGAEWRNVTWTINVHNRGNAELFNITVHVGSEDFYGAGPFVINGTNYAANRKDPIEKCTFGKVRASPSSTYDYVEATDLGQNRALAPGANFSLVIGIYYDARYCSWGGEVNLTDFYDISFDTTYFDGRTHWDSGYFADCFARSGARIRVTDASTAGPYCGGHVGSTMGRYFSTTYPTWTPYTGE